MTIINKQEQTSRGTLGKALQAARLNASLTVEDVAEKLNLAVFTVREIEDDLDIVIEYKKYPAIYLRGYIANYAKLVALANLEQFSEYQQLANRPKHAIKPCIPVVVPARKKRSKRLLFVPVLLMVLGLCLLVVKQFLFNENETSLPDIQESQPGIENPFVNSGMTPGKEKIAVSADAVVSEHPLAKKMANPLTVAEHAETAVLEKSESAEKVEDQVNVQQPLLDSEVVEPDGVVLESLQLAFSADCWTEIVDATGKRLAFDLYTKNALLTVKGVAPFQLKLGDPSVVAIQYQNKNFEHEFAAGRTIRFRIPQ